MTKGGANAASCSVPENCNQHANLPLSHLPLAAHGFCNKQASVCGKQAMEQDPRTHLSNAYRVNQAHQRVCQRNTQRWPWSTVSKLIKRCIKCLDQVLEPMPYRIRL